MVLRHRCAIGIVAVVTLATALAFLAPGGQPSLAQGDIIYVDAAAGGANDGTSWADAYTTLQPALAAASSGDQIWVAAGTYTPTWQVHSDPRSATFQMKNEVAIYGGFAGGETELGQRDWVANPTILSGDIGTEDDPADNAYHVFYHPDGTGLNSTAILDGFTITGGNADGSYPYNNGGGMLNYSSSPALANCTFSDNVAYNMGGGMQNSWYSSPALTNCTFSGNSASVGGGISNYTDSLPELTNCTFSGNEAAKSGGGMHNQNSASPTLTNCIFTGNSAGVNGGGSITRVPPRQR